MRVLFGGCCQLEQRFDCIEKCISVRIGLYQRVLFEIHHQGDKL